nr:MAG TPA: hypothetical protein [Caudoviricetes sp.]
MRVYMQKVENSFGSLSLFFFYFVLLQSKIYFQ